MEEVSWYDISNKIDKEMKHLIDRAFNVLKKSTDENFLNRENEVSIMYEGYPRLNITAEKYSVIIYNEDFYEDIIADEHRDWSNEQIEKEARSREKVDREQVINTLSKMITYMKGSIYVIDIWYSAETLNNPICLYKSKKNAQAKRKARETLVKYNKLLEESIEKDKLRQGTLISKLNDAMRSINES